LGANFDVARLVITPADETTIPPTAAVMESDERYRERIRLSWYARNTAGAVQAYEYFALSADSSVLDTAAYGPPITQPGNVDVYVINNSGDGTPDQALLDTVSDALNAEFVRPLTDFVTVKAPEIINYVVDAELVIGAGPDASTVIAAAEHALARYVESVHRIGAIVSIAGIYRALKPAGVEDVILHSPLDTLHTGTGQVPYCRDTFIRQYRDGVSS
jgi:phage-related baseplate assembly protein